MENLHILWSASDATGNTRAATILVVYVYGTHQARTTSQLVLLVL